MSVSHSPRLIGKSIVAVLTGLVSGVALSLGALGLFLSTLGAIAMWNKWPAFDRH